jgi:hypothetical protein
MTEITADSVRAAFPMKFMSERRKLGVLWVILAVLLVGGLVLASNVGNLSLNAKLGVGDVTALLTTFFVLALFVERTLEVFITAWRGEETVKRENELQTMKQALAQNPTESTLQEPVKTKTDWLVEYKCETQAIALRSGLVLGILIAAAGVRSFDTFVTGSVVTNSTSFWPNIQTGTFNVLDVLVSGGIIGGGSNAIHKMMNVITEFFDATAKKVKNS